MLSRIRIAIFAGTLLSLAVGLAPAMAQKHYKDLNYPKLGDIKTPNIERVVLKNGMILFLVEDRELPLVSLSARIGVGSINEPADKVGLAGITGSVMRTGGSSKMSGDAIDELLEGLGASVETGIGQTSGFASMSVLKEDVQTGLDVLAAIMMDPAFPQEKIDLAKVQARTGIARRNDDAGSITGREFAQLIYGEESPFARTSEYATIDAIERDDLVAFHKKYFQPNNVMIGVWGDFNKKEIVRQIEAAFKSWKKGTGARPKTPDVAYNFDYSVNFVRKEDVNQSNIRFGHIGGRRDNPDYFALTVMNDILSGSFTSRLFSRVRTEQGLAYSVFGSYTANYDYPGVFFVGCQTKSESTVKAIRSMLKEVELLKNEKVTQEELDLAKSSFFNSFVFNFDTRSELVGRMMTYEYYGYPKDFLQKIRDGIEKVTIDDVQRVARKYLQPDKVHILVVGNDADFDEPLSVLGEVNEIDITIPVVKENVPEATGATIEKARRVLAKSIEAVGGKEKFASMKTFTGTGSTLLVTPQGEFSMETEVMLAMPGKLRANINGPMGAISQIFNGEQGWMITPQGTQPAPPPILESMKSGLWYNIPYLFAQASRSNLDVQHVGEAEVAGAACDVILIQPKGVKPLKLFVNKATSMPAKLAFEGMSMMGAPAPSEIFITDFRDVGGIKVAFKTERMENGKKVQVSTFTAAKINEEIKPATFSPAN